MQTDDEEQDNTEVVSYASRFTEGERMFRMFPRDTLVLDGADAF